MNSLRSVFSFIFVSALVIIFISCSSKMTLPSDYYQRSGKIGVILEEMPRFNQYPASAINQYAEIASLAAAVEYNIEENNRRSRNNERIVDNVTVEFQLLLAQLLQARGRDAIVLLEPIDRKNLNKNDSGFGYDVRELAKKHGVKELMIVKVNQYGLWRQPGYEVNTYINMSASLVDATNNQLLWKTAFSQKDIAVDIPGEWVGIPSLTQYLKGLVIACSKSADAIVGQMDESGAVTSGSNVGLGTVGDE